METGISDRVWAALAINRGQSLKIVPLITDGYMVNLHSGLYIADFATWLEAAAFVASTYKLALKARERRLY